MEQQDSALLLRREDAIAWVTLNRPEAMNAINTEIRSRLPALLRELDADDSVRAIVLQGAGDRGFCAGADLREQHAKPTPLQARIHPRSAWFDVFDQVGKPVIAAIHGFCLGGGFEIALACDIRIASVDARFALPETGLGIIPGGGGTQRLPRLIGSGPALHLLLTGERIDTQEAWRLGVLAKVCADRAALQEEAVRLARGLAAKPPLALRFAKEAVREGGQRDLRGGIALERELFALLAASEDAQEAAAAFREKRPPVFTGR